MTLSSIVEALLIASIEPLHSKKISTLLKKSLPVLEEQIQSDNLTDLKKEALADQKQLLSKVSPKSIEMAIAELNSTYEEHNRSFHILKTNSGWKIYTRAEYAPYLELLRPEGKPQKLSQSAIETLAIIAYRQPSSKADIEAIRGVASDSMIQKLLKLDLIKVAGRSDAIGRPLVYAVTDTFLEKFGIESIKDLPNYHDLKASTKS